MDGFLQMPSYKDRFLGCLATRTAVLPTSISSWDALLQGSLPKHQGSLPADALLQGSLPGIPCHRLKRHPPAPKKDSDLKQSPPVPKKASGPCYKDRFLGCLATRVALLATRIASCGCFATRVASWDALLKQSLSSLQGSLPADALLKRSLPGIQLTNFRVSWLLVFGLSPSGLPIICSAEGCLPSPVGCDTCYKGWILIGMICFVACVFPRLP
ncbi:unnamed protein product [Polarella glacialis]|uniref:Uncharacterized protein n=1 Tax=Polarella glacialis TaxID=89957 RepID=A0A813EC08_POLGL|nr:unnamed protein product [Polarella glacialis]